jgi:hypothetical protein
VNIDQWRKIQRDFADWASVQIVHDDPEVAFLRDELQRSVEQLSGAEQQEFLDQTELKLGILLSPEAQKARAYVSRMIAVMATHRVDEFRNQLPGFTMTSAQMEQRLLDVQETRQFRQQRSAFETRNRQQRVQRTIARNDTERRTAFRRQAPTFTPPTGQTNPRAAFQRYPGFSFGGWFGFRW